MENQEQYISYKINTRNTYIVYVQEINGHRYYKVQVKKKNYDGTQTNFYKQLRFAKCEPPVNGDIIRITKGFEDLYENSKDKYNPISVIVVLEYEKQENKEQQEKEAYESYQNTLNENEELSDEDVNF